MHLIKSSGEKTSKCGAEGNCPVTAGNSNCDTHQILLSNETFNVLLRSGLYTWKTNYF